MSSIPSPPIMQAGVHSTHSETTLGTHPTPLPTKRESSSQSSLREGSSSPTVDHSSSSDSTKTWTPSTWARWRHRMREPIAEFLGTMILIIFGTGVDCQVVTSSSTQVASSQKGEYLTILLAWGMGTALGVWFSADISGGHLNPAVTLVQVVFRRFPLRKLPVYVLAQVAGAFTGSLLVYANYWKALELFEGGPGHLSVPGTAALFSTYPLPYMSSVSSFFSEFFATALLLITVLAVTDKRHGKLPPGLVPLALFIIITAIGAALGMQTAFALNPARDFGPRLMTAIFYGRQVWSFRNHYWIWTPIMGPIAGALSGAFVYDLFIYTGKDSRLSPSHDWSQV